jgi:hypothetical protein
MSEPLVSQTVPPRMARRLVRQVHRAFVRLVDDAGAGVCRVSKRQLLLTLKGTVGTVKVSQFLGGEYVFIG